MSRRVQRTTFGDPPSLLRVINSWWKRRVLAVIVVENGTETTQLLSFVGPRIGLKNVTAAVAVFGPLANSALWIPSMNVIAHRFLPFFLGCSISPRVESNLSRRRLIRLITRPYSSLVTHCT